MAARGAELATLVVPSDRGCPLATLANGTLMARRQALHPDRADVLTVLDAVLVKCAYLGEAELAVQRDRRLVGQDYAGKGDVHWLASEAFEQRAVKRRAYAVPSAAGVERDADFNGLPEAFVVPVGLAGGVTEDAIPAPCDKEPVWTGQGEALEPAPPFGDAGGLGGQGGV